MMGYRDQYQSNAAGERLIGATLRRMREEAPPPKRHWGGVASAAAACAAVCMGFTLAVRMLPADVERPGESTPGTAAEVVTGQLCGEQTAHELDSLGFWNYDDVLALETAIDCGEWSIEYVSLIDGRLRVILIREEPVRTAYPVLTQIPAQSMTLATPDGEITLTRADWQVENCYVGDEISTGTRLLYTTDRYITADSFTLRSELFDGDAAVTLTEPDFCPEPVSADGVTIRLMPLSAGSSYYCCEIELDDGISSVEDLPRMRVKELTLWSGSESVQRTAMNGLSVLDREGAGAAFWNIFTVQDMDGRPITDVEVTALIEAGVNDAETISGSWKFSLK